MRRTLLWIEAGLVLASLGLLGWCASVWWTARQLQAEATTELRQPAPLHRVRPLEGALLGEVEIPRIGLATPILEGDDDATLRLAAGHIPGTALPGVPGNLCIAGHRDTVFRALRGVAIGDRLLIDTQGSGESAYRVQSVEIVQPRDTWVLDRTPTDAVTLVTCYPFHYIGAAPERFVVRAVKDPQSARLDLGPKPVAKLLRGG
jgi:sortase A